MLGSAVANPHGLKLVDGVFPPSVYDAFPKMIRTLAGFYFAMGLLAACMVRPAAVVAERGRKVAPAASSPNDRTFAEALRSPVFYLLWTLILIAAPAGVSVAAVYKTYALTSEPLADDGARAGAVAKAAVLWTSHRPQPSPARPRAGFLSLAGGLATLCNGLGRVGWATLSDKLGFKNTFFALALTQAAACLSYTNSAIMQSRLAFLVVTCVFLACMGGHFAMFPTACANTFGVREGASIYAVMFSAFGLASIAGVTLTKELQRRIGWIGVFRLFAAMSVTSAVASRAYKPLPPRPRK